MYTNSKSPKESKKTLVLVTVLLIGILKSTLVLECKMKMLMSIAFAFGFTLCCWQRQNAFWAYFSSISEEETYSSHLHHVHVRWSSSHVFMNVEGVEIKRIELSVWKSNLNGHFKDCLSSLLVLISKHARFLIWKRNATQYVFSYLTLFLQIHNKKQKSTHPNEPHIRNWSVLMLKSGGIRWRNTFAGRTLIT